MQARHDPRRTVSNGTLQLSIDARDLSGRIRLLAREGGEWTIAPLAHLRIVDAHGTDAPWTVASITEYSAAGNGMEAVVARGGDQYRLRVYLSSDEPEVVFELEPIEESQPLRAVSFPGPMLPARGAITDVVLPKTLTNGIVHHPAHDDHWAHVMNVASQAGLNMPFWGIGADRYSVLAVMDTADDVALAFTKTIRQPIEVSPTWTASLGQLRYQRRLRCRFLEENSYVRMAKEYRAQVIAAGRFKSLLEKIEERPIVRQVIGGPYFSVGYLPFSERKFRQVVRGLREIGYSNGLIGPVSHIQWDSGNWLNDYQPFIDAPSFRAIASRAGFAAFAWLYLEDILRWDPYFDPAWLVRGADGREREGWFNRDYEYALICSKVLREVHVRLKERMTQYEALHFDTTTAKELTECWDPDHRMSRSEDRESRRARLAEVAGWGILIGSESGYDWAFDVYDFCSSNPRRALETGFPAPARHIPLLGLVYHDAVVSYNWEYDPYNKSYFGGDWSRDKLLFDMMAGNPPTVAPVMGYFPVIRRPAPPVEARWVTWEAPETQQLLRDALPVAQWHHRTAHMQMIDHAFLDARGLVSRTTYADGSSALVNAGTEPAGSDESNQPIPPQSYRVV